MGKFNKNDLRCLKMNFKGIFSTQKISTQNYYYYYYYLLKNFLKKKDERPATREKSTFLKRRF